MRNYFWLINAAFIVFFFSNVTSYCAEEKRSLLNKDLFSVDFSKTDLKLSLIGTVTRKGFGTAIIKNTSTGELKSYAQGDVIDLIPSEKVKLSAVSDCTVILERNGKYETLSCRSDDSEADGSYDESISEEIGYKLFSPLARYKIITRPKEVKKSSPILTKLKSGYEDYIIAASNKHGMDPYLVKAVIKAESNFNPLAVSSKNAMGMMQLIPETASDYGVENPFDPNENIDGGVRFLRDLMNYFDSDLKLALAAYNAGKGAVIRHGFQIPPYTETINYVDRVMAYYRLLKEDR
ncbi:MAG: transglycosylase SLT domain-containing protein [Thermodesulfobacteriota bacterium]